MKASRFAWALVVLTSCVPPGVPGDRSPAPGDTYVLLERQRTPSGTVEVRETWQLADTLQGHGRFVVSRAGRVSERSRQLDRASRRGDAAARLESVRVPAGSFRCRRTQRGFTEHNGRVMRVDEWWAAGVPVPVQRWSRWNGLPPARFEHAPRDTGELVMGAEWTVLERAPRR